LGIGTCQEILPVEKLVTDVRSDGIPDSDGRWLVRRRFTEGNHGVRRHVPWPLNDVGEPLVELFPARVADDDEVDRRVQSRGVE
jgi:hypothetical protein